MRCARGRYPTGLRLPSIPAHEEADDATHEHRDADGTPRIVMHVLIRELRNVLRLFAQLLLKIAKPMLQLFALLRQISRFHTTSFYPISGAHPIRAINYFLMS